MRPHPKGVPLILVGLLLVLIGKEVSQSRRQREGTVPRLQEVAEVQAPLKLPLTAPRLVVQKGQRRLLLYSGTQLLRTYPIGLGRNPTDDKTREGDGCTPEGQFSLIAKNPRSKFYLSLHLNYPGVEAAKRGLAEQRITQTEYRQIIRAIRRGVSPPQNTALGGQIFLHGGGSGADWTLGCVALDNRNMRELYPAVEVGTKVVIEP